MISVPDIMPFIECILDNPEEEGPRLVFSDWLEERGDKRVENLRAGPAMVIRSNVESVLGDLRVSTEHRSVIVSVLNKGALMYEFCAPAGVEASMMQTSLASVRPTLFDAIAVHPVSHLGVSVRIRSTVATKVTGRFPFLFSGSILAFLCNSKGHLKDRVRAWMDYLFPEAGIMPPAKADGAYSYAHGNMELAGTASVGDSLTLVGNRVAMATKDEDAELIAFDTGVSGDIIRVSAKVPLARFSH